MERTKQEREVMARILSLFRPFEVYCMMGSLAQAGYIDFPKTRD